MNLAEVKVLCNGIERDHKIESASDITTPVTNSNEIVSAIQSGIQEANCGIASRLQDNLCGQS